MLAGDAGSGGVFTPVKTTWRQRACYFRRGMQHVFACGPCPPWTAAAARADAEPQTLCVTAKGAHVFFDGAVRPSAFAPRESLPLLDSKQTCSLCHGRRRLSPGPVAAPERQPAPPRGPRSVRPTAPPSEARLPDTRGGRRGSGDPVARSGSQASVALYPRQRSMESSTTSTARPRAGAARARGERPPHNRRCPGTH